MAQQLYRSNTNRKIAGICGGIGNYFDIDPVLVRLIWLLFVFMGGTGIFAYLIGWLIIPLENSSN
ncbi:TPA: PspC domain-containing protein [Candidatus Dependentiae bacterium]|nr:MAG: hypothetical protein UR14_C0001G0109 [candidate division TM6 bacterium GW2011_GWE2_31_21]KKP54011.1 MAG: hypothetical protein UR43_C0001G0029 [candidate division TM6 bacterium GW2011_GWF2_33_332]HBS48408.1 PspC domain-containing protein [Candidatus Dependentiae bacterium]HBZ72918.1 PspC domain-containing protein [Candidatus Dependentiae bacterium]